MKRSLGYIFVLIFFLLIVEGALPQVQMALLSGNIIIKSIILKVILVLSVLIGLLLHVFRLGTVIWPRSITIPYILFLMYLVVHFLLLREDYPLDYLLQSYNTYYFFMLLFPLAAYVPVKTGTFSRVLTAISIPLLILGFAQYFSNSPILPLSSADQYFKVFSVDYYGKTRAFSLFNSGLNYGHFISLLGAFTMYFMLKRRGLKRINPMILSAVVTLACYTTLTRNLYIEYLFTLLTVVLLSARNKYKASSIYEKTLKAIPVLYGVVAALVVFATQLLDLVSNADSMILKQESLLVRIMGWKYYFPLWMESGLQSMLVGIGLIQSERFPITENVVIDNSFLAVGLHIGVLGLLLWMVFMWRLWTYLLVIQRKVPDNAPIMAMVALCSTWVSSGLFSINFSLYAVLSLMVFSIYLTDMKKRLPAKQAKPAMQPCGTAG